ncbi:MAG TPA: prepilin-type N-terminal cleavage/methylation domain-containing protein, partial [Microthrixaceae bacterium]|nr:prepilin-type N-terminal cleavage/methylation domain-containing protein [Microthrixaceae bacterium]
MAIDDGVEDHMHRRSLTASPHRRNDRRRNEHGYTLIEVMIASLLAGILLAGLAGWTMTSMRSLSQVRGWAIDQAGTDRINRTLVNDAATALVIVTPTTGSPMLDCQNLPLPNVYYGEPDLTPDVVALVGSLNFTLSNWARIIKWYANPRQYVTGVSSGATLDVAADKTLMLPTGATLGLLQINSDLAGTAEFARRLEEAVHELTATPAIATGKLESVGALSGVALQVLYA